MLRRTSSSFPLLSAVSSFGKQFTSLSVSTTTATSQLQCSLRLKATGKSKGKSGRGEHSSSTTPLPPRAGTTSAILDASLEVGYVPSAQEVTGYTTGKQQEQHGDFSSESDQNKHTFLFLLTFIFIFVGPAIFAMTNREMGEDLDSKRAKFWNGISHKMIKVARAEAAADFPEFFGGGGKKELADFSAATKHLESEMLLFFYVKDLADELLRFPEYKGMSRRDATIKALDIDVGRKTIGHARLRSLIAPFKNEPLTLRKGVDQALTLSALMSSEADLKASVPELQTFDDFLKQNSTWKQAMTLPWPDNCKELSTYIPVAAISHGDMSCFRHYLPQTLWDNIRKSARPVVGGSSSSSSSKTHDRCFPVTITPIWALQCYAMLERIKTRHGYVNMSTHVPDITSFITRQGTSFLKKYLFQPESLNFERALNELVGIDLKEAGACSHFSLGPLLPKASAGGGGEELKVDEAARKSASIQIREKMKSSRCAVVRGFKLTPDFVQAVISRGETRFEGANFANSSSSNNSSSPQTVMLVIGHRRAAGGSKDFFLVQNFHEKSQFFECDAQFLSACGCNELLFIDRDKLADEHNPNIQRFADVTMEPTVVFEHFLEVEDRY